MRRISQWLRARVLVVTLRLRAVLRMVPGPRRRGFQPLPTVTLALALAPVLAVIVAVLLAGCGPAVEPSDGSATPPGSGQPGSGQPGSATAPSTPPAGSSTGSATPRLTAVTVTRTGGIAGVMQQLVISPNGSWTYTDRKTQASQTGQLTAAQAAQLASLLANPALSAEARITPPPIACNDSFVYTITAGELSLRYDQCAAQGKRPVTDQLVAAVVDATPL